jgi:copper chaperone CopZ
MRKLLFTAALIPMLASAAQAETIKATVNGLVCAFCATGIEKTLKAESAVDHVKVDLESKLVTIGTKQGQTMDDTTITKLITDAGYSVTDIKREK